jgi:hypothetical protein
MAIVRFKVLTLNEFQNWLANEPITRSIEVIQNHHTWKPDYKRFTGSNHVELLEAMHAAHIARGWEMIGQNITTFPDGKIGICRPFNRIPACIYKANEGDICIENLGNFDIDGDVMTVEQRDTIVALNAMLCIKLDLFPSIDEIVYHNWFDAETGEMVGSPNLAQKSCPGTNFFGGNTTEAAEENFLPLVRAKIGELNTSPNPKLNKNKIPRGLVISNDALNVRDAPNMTGKIVDKLQRGIQVGIYEEKSGWYRVDRLYNRWVAAKYIRKVNI